jgi:hypothetical protein
MSSFRITTALNYALSDKQVYDKLKAKSANLSRDIYAIHTEYAPKFNNKYEFVVKIYFDFWDENYKLTNEDLIVYVGISNDKYEILFVQDADN